MNNSKPSGLRIDVFLVFLATLFIAGVYTVTGCTRGGVYGVYEGITNIIQDMPADFDQESDPDSDNEFDSFKGHKAKKHHTASSSSKSKKSKKTDKKPKGVLSSISNMIGGFFTGKSYSGFDNMGTQFRNISFDSATTPEPGVNDFFNGVSFSSKCCPSRYSTDTGCACLGDDKYKIIRARGGNNVPISEW